MVADVLSRAARAVRSDLSGFAAALGGGKGTGPAPGLHTYDFEGNGGRTRLHLRAQPDGTGLLFVDVTDVLHLSGAATMLAWLALEDVPEARALATLARRYRGRTRGELAADYRRMREVVASLASPGEGCRTCQLDLPKTPLFATRAQAPHKVDLALTYACNNDCPHCYNEPSRFDLDSLDAAGWRRVLDQLASVGVPQVDLHRRRGDPAPGAPRAHRPRQRPGDDCRPQHQRPADLAPEYMQALAAAGLDHVQVTLESHRPEVHDAMVHARAFHQTVRGIEAALAAGVHAITNTTITRLNAGEIEETVDFLHELGLDTFAMNGMIYSGGGEDTPDAIPADRMAPILVQVRDRAAEHGMRFLWYTVTEYCEMSPVELEVGAKRCNAGEYSMCVEPTGDVLPCQSYYTSAGNLLRDPWEQIWKGALFRSFRDRETDPVLAGLPDKCQSCPDLPVCGGGCRIEREVREGTAPGGCQSCATGGVHSSGVRSSGCSAATPETPLVQIGGAGC